MSEHFRQTRFHECVFQVFVGPILCSSLSYGFILSQLQLPAVHFHNDSYFVPFGERWAASAVWSNVAYRDTLLRIIHLQPN